MTADPEQGSAMHVVLDLDGTLLPGFPGIQYLSDLIDDGACHRDEAAACIRAIERYGDHEEGRADLMAEAYRHYAAALRGIPTAQAQATALGTWKACRRRLFPFVGDLVDLFKSHHCRIGLISGNADMPIQEAVADLGLDWGRGALTEIVDGSFTDRLVRAPGLSGGKDAVMREVAASGDFDQRNSWAVGNTASDAEVFAHVDVAIAFEPDAELRALSEQHPWHIADRDTIVPTCARLLSARRPR